MKSTFILLVAAVVLMSHGGGVSSQTPHKTRPAGTPEYTFKVVHMFPHDSSAYTQGLIFHQGVLYEGTGLNGRSSLRKVRMETGEVLQRVDLSAEFFGEGIALLHGEIAQLTWRSHKGFIYSLSDFRRLREFSYPGEGWGLTTDGRDFYMSDGTAEIRVLDGPGLLKGGLQKAKRRVTVHDGGKNITQLNELEWVDGEIFANIWQTDHIARISPQTGKVIGWIDLKGLLSPMFKLEDGAVLNGIAYDAATKRLFVTGKLWPSVFEIQLVPNPQN